MQINLKFQNFFCIKSKKIEFFFVELIEILIFAFEMTETKQL